VFVPYILALYIRIRILFGFPQKLFQCGSFRRPKEIYEMADTAFEATTHYTCVLYCHSTLYSKLSYISASMLRLVVSLGFMYISDEAAVFHIQGETASLKKLS
jgi:hypothetical protein